jgi:uncharacterized membrane protein YphA (DoxX/SURF4 family)
VHAMTNTSIAANWSAMAPRLLSLLRIVAAFMFVLSGTLKLWAFPIGMPPSSSPSP